MHFGIFLGPDVLFSTGVMMIVCICEQNCVSSVCFVILVQGQGLIENDHRKNSI